MQALQLSPQCYGHPSEGTSYKWQPGQNAAQLPPRGCHRVRESRKSRYGSQKCNCQAARRAFGRLIESAKLREKKAVLRTHCALILYHYSRVTRSKTVVSRGSDTEAAVALWTGPRVKYIMFSGLRRIRYSRHDPGRSGATPSNMRPIWLSHVYKWSKPVAHPKVSQLTSVMVQSVCVALRARLLCRRSCLFVRVLEQAQNNGDFAESDVGSLARMSCGGLMIDGD